MKITLYNCDGLQAVMAVGEPKIFVRVPSCHTSMIHQNNQPNFPTKGHRRVMISSHVELSHFSIPTIL